MVNPVALIGGINYEWMVDISMYYWICNWLYVLWEGQLKEERGGRIIYFPLFIYTLIKNLNLMFEAMNI